MENISAIEPFGGHACAFAQARGTGRTTHADEPEVRRVGFARFALLPPSRAGAPLPLYVGGSSGSGGGLCAMLEKPKFVPMARPYASHIPNIFYMYSSSFIRLRFIHGKHAVTPLQN